MRRGVSEIMAAVLLMATAAAVGMTLYMFFTARVAEELSRPEPPPFPEFSVPWSYYDSTAGELVVFVHNFGGRVVRLDSLYIGPERYEVGWVARPGVWEFRLAVALAPGTHACRLVSAEGVGASFAVEV